MLHAAGISSGLVPSGAGNGVFQASNSMLTGISIHLLCADDGLSS